MYALTVASRSFLSRTLSTSPPYRANSLSLRSLTYSQSSRSRTNFPPGCRARRKPYGSAPEPARSPNYTCLHTLTRLSPITTFTFKRLQKLRSFFFPHHQKPNKRGHRFSTTYTLFGAEKMTNSHIFRMFRTLGGGVHTGTDRAHA